MRAKQHGSGKRGVKRNRGQADLKRVDATTDADIARQIAEDPDTAPEFTDAMFEKATWMAPLKKVPIALRLDPDIIDFFRTAGPGYQSRINAVLGSYVSLAKRVKR